MLKTQDISIECDSLRIVENNRTCEIVVDGKPIDTVLDLTLHRSWDKGQRWTLELTKLILPGRAVDKVGEEEAGGLSLATIPPKRTLDETGRWFTPCSSYL